MIDIIIPLYNGNTYLDRLLKSIEKQNYKDYKVYLIDANSNEKYNLDIYKDINITYLKLNKKTCPGLTRQKGIDISNSKYIMFIDQDDELINKDSLSQLINNIKDYDILSSGEYFEKENINMINDISLHGKLFKRSFLEKHNIKFNDFIYHEDTYFNNKCFLENAKIKQLNIVTYFYHDNLDSIINKTKDIEIEKMEYLLKIIKTLKKEIPINKNNINRYKELIFKNYDYFIKIFSILEDNEKDMLASFILKHDKYDQSLMLSKSNIELKERIDQLYKL